MAEPQANTPSEQSRQRENGGPAEARTFDKPQTTRGGAQPPDQTAPGVADGARAVAETSRRAGRDAAELMRQTFDPLMAVQLDMQRWVDDLWRQTFGFRASQGLHAMRPFGAMGAAGLFGMPPADLQETDQAHILALELPGLNKDDVDIAIDGDLITVSGHKAEETQDASAAFRVSERRFGRFERSFPLPPDVDRQAIEAQFRDGVLKIVLPRDQAVSNRRAKIAIRG